MKRVIQVSLAMGIAVFLAALLIFQIHEVPPLSQIRKTYQPSIRIVLDREGQILDQIRTRSKDKTSRLPWISLTQIPFHFREMLEKSEGNRLGHRVSKLVQNHLRRSNDWLKVLALQSAWTRDQQLEAFINLAIFNESLQGVNALSFSLFDKPAVDMDRAESALALALLNFSLSQVEDVRQEACARLAEIEAQADCAMLSAQHLHYLAKSFSIQPYTKMAPHLAKALEAEPQLKEQVLVRSTIDREAQWAALHELQARGHDGAIVAMENATGNVLVYVGNIGATSKLPYRDGTSDPRSSGALLKPFIFAQALDEHIVTMNTGLETTPRLMTPNMVSVRKALASNMNVPAMRILELVGSDSFLRLLKTLGFSNLERAGFYGPSLVLGSAEVRLMEMTNAYRVLASGGQWSPVRLSPDLITESAAKSVLSSGAAYLVNNVLSQNLKTPYWSAGQCLENWCVGFTEKYTVGVWSEGDSAGPVWLKVMGHLQKSEKSEPPMKPDQLLLSGGELYLKGTEPVAEIPRKGLISYKSRISFPLDQSLIAMSPDSKKSGMFIQVVAPRSDQNLYLNGRRLGRAQSLQPWEPEAGKYVLELRDSQGQVLDKVQFVVRGRRFAQNL